MVGLIILNYNNPSVTIDCFESIQKWNTYPCKYVFVDNASIDNSVPYLDAYFSEHYAEQYRRIEEGQNIDTQIPRISLIVAAANKGYACGNNIGCKYLERDNDIDYYLILNNDIIFIQDIIPELVYFLENHAEAAVATVLQYAKDGKTINYNTARNNHSNFELFVRYLQLYPLLDKYNCKRQLLRNNPSILQEEYHEIELPVGAFMLIKKDIFKEVGYFDPNTFLFFEENILYKKIKRLGLKNYLLPQLKCIHLESVTIKHTKFSYFQKMQLSRSSYYYGMNYADMSWITKLLFSVLYAYNYVVITMVFYFKKALKLRVKQ